MFAVSMTTGKLLLYCQANITQRGGSFKTARLVVSYQSGIWQLLQQFICVTNKLLTEGMLNIVLKVTEVLHMRPNLAAFFLPQLGFIVEHPEGKLPKQVSRGVSLIQRMESSSAKVSPNAASHSRTVCIFLLEPQVSG